MKVQAYILSLLKKTPFNDVVKDSDNLEIIKGTGTTLSLKIGGLIFSYIFHILFARLYGAEVMGIFALAITVAGIFSLFGQMGTDTSLVRFIAQYSGQGNYRAVKEIYKKIIELVLPASIFFSVLFYITSPWIANYIFHNHRLIIPFKITAFVLPFGALMGVNTASLRGLKKIKEAFIFSTALPPVLNTVGLMGLTYFVFKSYLTPIYVNLITVFIGASYSLILWKKQSSKLFISKNDSDNIPDKKEIIKVSIPMSVTSAMVFIMGWTDIFMLGIFRNTIEVGIYRIALKLALTIGFVYIAVNSITSPKFAEIYWNAKSNRLKSLVKFSGKIALCLAIPLFLILVVLGKKILIIFGLEFEKGYLAMSILSIGQFVSAVYGVFGYLLNMTGNEKYLMKSITFAAICNVVLNYFMIQAYGILGASISTTFSIIVMNLFLFYYKLKLVFHVMFYAY